MCFKITLCDRNNTQHLPSTRDLQPGSSVNHPWCLNHPEDLASSIPCHPLSTPTVFLTPPWPWVIQSFFFFLYILAVYIVYWFDWQSFRGHPQSVLESHTPGTLSISAFGNNQSMLPGPWWLTVRATNLKYLFPICVDLLDWFSNPASLLQSGSLSIPHFWCLPLSMNFQLMTCLC